MNNGRGESGERRESHSVTIQWCSRDQSKTTALKRGICKVGYCVNCEKYGHVHRMQIQTSLSVDFLPAFQNGNSILSLPTF